MQVQSAKVGPFAGKLQPRAAGCSFWNLYYEIFIKIRLFGGPSAFAAYGGGGSGGPED
jgi:hypothetical protein